MKKIKELFTSCKMTWGFVVLFALATGVLTAVLNMIPALGGTSFQDIAISVECWILFAVFIVINCKKPVEAALKTFVFFLISQPLIYLIEILFTDLDFNTALGYYRYWGFVTVLTIPGAVCCFLLKRKDLISAASLSVAIIGLSYIGAGYFHNSVFNFPYHLLSAVFCVLLSLFLIYIVFDDKKLRALTLAVTAVSLAVCLYIKKPLTKWEIDLPAGQWSYSTENNDSVISVTQDGDCEFTVKAEKMGDAKILFTCENGEIREFIATVTAGGIFCSDITY